MVNKNKCLQLISSSILAFTLGSSLAIACDSGTKKFKTELSGPFTITNSKYVFKDETFNISRNVEVDINEFLKVYLGEELGAIAPSITSRSFPNGKIKVSTQAVVKYHKDGDIFSNKKVTQKLRLRSDFKNLKEKTAELKNLVCVSQAKNTASSVNVTSLNISTSDTANLLALAKQQLSHQLDSNGLELIWSTAPKAKLANQGIKSKSDLRKVILKNFAVTADSKDLTHRLKNFIHSSVEADIPNPSPVAGAKFGYMNTTDVRGAYAMCGSQPLRGTLEVNCSDQQATSDTNNEVIAK